MKKLPLLLAVVLLALCVSLETQAGGVKQNAPEPTRAVLETPPPVEDLALAVHQVALKLPKPYGERESEEARARRLWLVADAIASAALAQDDWPGKKADLASFLLTFAWWETRLSLRIHRMGPRKDTKGFAIGLTSLHSWTLVPYAEWRTLGGIEGTDRLFEVSARVVSWARRRCGATRADWPEASFALLAGGGRCRWSGAGNRAFTYRRVVRAMDVELGTRSS